MIFWKIATKLIMIDLQILRTNQALQVKFICQYINRNGNGMA